MFERKITSELKMWMDSKKKEALLIKGARQVGKTFIIENFISKNFQSHIKLDLREDVELRKMFDGPIDSDNILGNIKTKYPDFKLIDGDTAIFIDEIQTCPNARMALKYMSLDRRYKTVASGSLLGLTYSDTDITNPVGYEKDVEMLPMDFEEFLWATGVDQSVIDEIRKNIHEKKQFDEFRLRTVEQYFLTYCAVGGMPEAVASFLENKDIGEARTVQKKIVSGYRDDVAKYSKTIERDRVLALYDSIPNQIGFDRKKFVFKDVENTVCSIRTYEYGIRWLIDAGMTRKCVNVTEPAHPLKSNEIPNNFKIYVNDTGLMMSMFNNEIVHGFLAGDHRINKGRLIENAVAQNIYASERSLNFFAKDSLEIDFVIPLGMDITAMEVKSGNNKKSKSLESIKENYGVKRRMKFEKGNIDVDKKGVEHYPLFACAFVDAMYTKKSLKVKLPKL